MSAARRGLQLLAVLAAGAGLHAVATGATAGARAEAEYRWSLPKGFPTPAVPEENPMSAAKAAVGRRLFYDVRLSGNQTQSCGSCHQQKLAFTDGRALALGSTGQAHPRNAQPLANVAFMKTLTWANPALVTLERQIEVPLFGTTPVELGVNDRNRDRILKRIRDDPWYAKAFRRAFPGSIRPVSWTTVVRSIAAFQRTIISADSPYDRYLKGRAKLTAAQRRGMNLFMGEKAECHHCHGSFIFNDQARYVGSAPEPAVFHNTGLFNLGGTGAYPEPNRGLFEITGRAQDMGKFRAPSLRNVELTAPYLHDGSMATLEEVVDHYAAGGRVIADGPLAGDGRASPFKDELVAGIALSPRERADLVAFLKALTDRSLTTDPRFADPFAARAPKAAAAP